MWLATPTHSPPEFCPPLCDVDCEEYIRDHRREDNESEPSVKRYDEVDDSHAYVDQRWGNVEQNVAEEIVDALSTSIHNTKNFTYIIIAIKKAIQKNV